MYSQGLSNSNFQQGIQVLRSRRASSCQNCCGMGQRDKRLVSTIRSHQHFISRIFFSLSLSCCSNRNAQSNGDISSLWCLYALRCELPRSLFKRTEDEYIPDAESVRQVKEQHMQPQTCSLAQCFQLYTKEEQVGWHNLPSSSSARRRGEPLNYILLFLVCYI